MWNGLNNKRPDLIKVRNSGHLHLIETRVVAPSHPLPLSNQSLDARLGPLAPRCLRLSLFWTFSFSISCTSLSSLFLSFLKFSLLKNYYLYCFLRSDFVSVTYYLIFTLLWIALFREENLSSVWTLVSLAETSPNQCRRGNFVLPSIFCFRLRLIQICTVFYFDSIKYELHGIEETLNFSRVSSFSFFDYYCMKKSMDTF